MNMNRLMETGPPPLVEITWALVQTLPVNKKIHKKLSTIGDRCVYSCAFAYVLCPLHRRAA